MKRLGWSQKSVSY